jgi:putative transposase
MKMIGIGIWIILNYNPVKHGLVTKPSDWVYSSFNRAVKQGRYESNWGTNSPESILGMKRE